MMIKKIDILYILKLKKENSILKEELSKKQEQINKTNAYYKRLLNKQKTKLAM